MVKILITEDDEKKLEEIVQFVRQQGILDRDILIAKTLVEFMDKLSDAVDICVIDLRIPAYPGAKAEQNGIAIIQRLGAVSHANVKLLAISAFPDEFESTRSEFERHGCILANYHCSDVWQNALKILILQSAARSKFDFLIFTALQKERAPYVTLSELGGEEVTSDGLTRFDIELADRRGSIIELPRMGLVDAAIIAGKCIERYAPKLVAMSGICAGFENNASLGQLLVSEIAYEYQAGKWASDGFKAEPYQIPISETLRTQVRHLIGHKDIIQELERDWKGSRPSRMVDPKLATFTSGSAVIADEKKMRSVGDHHRKVSGLDMEVYSIHRAAHLSKIKPDVLCSKVVVDLANAQKDDELQDYGCYVSSKFVLQAIKYYFDQLG